MASYVGNIPIPQATQTRQVFNLTASQTTVNTIGYTNGFVDVWMNGSKILEGVDWNVGGGNGSDIVLASGASAGDFLEVLIFTAEDLATASGGGRYKGERGTVGAAAGAGDIFRVHEQQLDTNTTIDSTENALCAGPLTVASGVTLTVSGNLTVV